MPWVSIIMWVLSFVISKSSGASNAKAAMIATGAGLATYYLADPANADNVLGIGTGDKASTGAPTETATNASTSAPKPSWGSTIVSEVGGTLRSWGPTGTLGVVAGTTALTSTGSSKFWLYAALAAGVLLIIK